MSLTISRYAAPRLRSVPVMDARNVDGPLAERLQQSRQLRGHREMLHQGSARLRGLLGGVSFVTGETARELVADFPWPVRLRTLLPCGLMPSRSGLRDWRFREYDRWDALCADLGVVPVGGLGFGYLYAGPDVPVFLIDLGALAPLLGDLAAYLDAAGLYDCVVASASLDAGLVIGSHAGSMPGEAVFELCTWGLAGVFDDARA